MGSYRSRSIYQLLIQLEEIEPAIWRRISVPGKISLARLHRLLQLAMGWENYHLHLFTIGGVHYGEPDPEYAAEGIQIKHDRHASVRDALRTEGMRFRYDYDFGDNWRHDVLVERIKLLDAEDWVAPRCLDGRRACPPEDCGGVSGYDKLLEALRDPHHDDHERMRTWGLRLAGLSLLETIDVVLASYHWVRLLNDAYTSRMSGEPALSAVRFLANQGQFFPLYGFLVSNVLQEVVRKKS